jgi:mRNA deadenylase 3'-5' endonuclease subunit Ccr4
MVYKEKLSRTPQNRRLVISTYHILAPEFMRKDIYQQTQAHKMWR